MAKPTATKTRIENPVSFAGDTPEIVPDPSEYSGTFFKVPDPKRPRAGDGRNYSLCIVKDDPRDNTHKLRCEPEYVLEEDDAGNTVEIMVHPGFSWEGNAAEFKAQFEKA